MRALCQGKLSLASSQRDHFLYKDFFAGMFFAPVSQP
jgi:hypothetical protein